MSVKVLMNDVKNDLRTIGLGVPGWARVVIVLQAEDGLGIIWSEDNPNELKLTRKPGAHKANG